MLHFLKRFGLSYYSVKQVRVRSATLGATYYLLCALIAAYFVYSFWVGHGYQAQGALLGSVDVKVKGQAFFVNANGTFVVDATDLVQVESDGIFVATAFNSYEQTRGTCTGLAADGACTVDANCTAQSASTNGVRTGVCDTTAQLCQIEGWCPPEPASANATVLQGAEAFTIYIRQYARFPKFQKLLSLSWNNLDVGNSGSTSTTPGWNLWTMTELLTIAGVNMADPATAAAIWSAGADLVLTLELDCNLDMRRTSDVLQSQCSPAWSPGAQLYRPVTETDEKSGRIYRLDTSSSLSVGANRRFTSLPMGGGDDVSGSPATRTLTKAYGIKMQVLLTGVGRKFDATETATHVGAGLALFGIATALVDLLAIYVFPRRAFYSAHKYEQVDGEVRDAPSGAAAGGWSAGEEGMVEEGEEGEETGGAAAARPTRRKSLMEEPLLSP